MEVPLGRNLLLYQICHPWWKDSLRYFFCVWRADIFVPLISADLGVQHFAKFIKHFIKIDRWTIFEFLGMYIPPFIVALLLVYPLNDNYFTGSYKFLCHDLIGYMLHTNNLISWILRLFPYHAKLVEVLFNALFILYIYTSDDVFDSQHNLFSCWLMSIIPDITMLFMILLCCLLFTLNHKAEFVNKKISIICLFWKGTILINYHTDAFMVFILQCC